MTTSVTNSPAVSITAPQFEVGQRLDLPKEEVQTSAAPVAVEKKEVEQVHVCPGHTKLFHRYLTEKRAEKRTAKAVKKLIKEDCIKEASFKVIKKSDPNGAMSGFFNGLNRIYKCATQIVFKHTDGSDACPYHPNHKA